MNIIGWRFYLDIALGWNIGSIIGALFDPTPRDWLDLVMVDAFYISFAMAFFYIGESREG